MSLSKRVMHIHQDCVACGSCVKVCPKGAVSVYKGLYAVVNPSQCVGCGKCAVACPAGIIEIVEREAMTA